MPLTAQQSAAWNEVVALTRVLVEQVRAEEWEAASRTETERRQALESFFAHPIPADEQAAVRGFVEGLLELDRHLAAGLVGKRDEVSQRLKELQAGAKAQAAYKDNR